MKIVSKWAVIALFLVSLPVFAQQPQSISGGIFIRTTAPAAVETPFPADAGFFRISGSDFTQTTSGLSEVVRLENFPLGSITVNLAVEQFEVLTPDAKIGVSTAAGFKQVKAPSHILLKGEVEEIAGSHVYLAIFADHAVGYIEIPGYRYLIQPVTLSSETLNTMIVYKESDIDRSVLPQRSWNCATDELPSNQKRLEKIEAELQAPMQSLKEEPLAKMIKVLKLDIEADYEYFVDHKQDTAKAIAYAIADVGAVSDIYVRDLSAAVQIQYLNVWTEWDPFTDGPTTWELLAAFDVYGPSVLPDDNRAGAILLSGVDDIGGLAHLGGLCDDGEGYCVAATDNTYTFPQDGFVWDVNVVSHEFGHVVGSPHTHSCYWSPAIDSCYPAEGGCFQDTVRTKGTIMSYCHLNPKGSELKFHTRNIPQLKQWIAQGGCGASLPLPTAKAGADTYRCGPDSVTLSGSVSDGSLPFTYSWRLLPSKTQISTTPKIKVRPTAATSRYVLRVTDSKGLRTYDTVIVTSNNLKADAGKDMTVCGVNTVALTGVSSSGFGSHIYQWLDSASGVIIGSKTSIIADAPQSGSKTYSFKVTDSVGCVSTDHIIIKSSGKPDAAIVPLGTPDLCEGDTLTLDAGAGFTSYKWSNNRTTRTISVTNAGSYSVIVANGGCADTSSAVTVTLKPAPAKPVVTKNGSELVASDALSYQWFRNDIVIGDATSKNYSPLDNGSFYVMITGSNGCTSKSEPVAFSMGVEDELLSSVSIRPNPATDQLTIEWQQIESSILSMYITDLLGNKVVEIAPRAAGSSSSATVDIHSLQAGTYFLHYSFGGAESVKKFVKQ